MAVSIEQSPLGIYHMTGNTAIPQYTDWVVNIAYTVNNGVGVDFTTYTAKLQVKQNYDSPVLLELNTSNGGITLSNNTVTPTNPNITLTFLKGLTNSMTVYDGMIYDLELTSASGLITRIMKGQFALDRAVTH